VWPADIGPLGPCKPEPAEVFDRRLTKFLAASRPVEILDSQHEASSAGSRRGYGEGPRMANVEKAGGRRGKATAHWHRGVSNGS
jgi:hypothetical protein